jgi:20S proteasome alpha/beta subunit
MKFCNVKNKVSYIGDSSAIAVTKSITQAEIIVKVLNYYFDTEHFNRNESVEMMHKNTANSLSQIADHCEKYKYTAAQIIEYLRELFRRNGRSGVGGIS